MKILLTGVFTYLFLNATIAQTTVINEDFATGLNGFTAVSISDAADVWTATSGYVEMNGFGGTDDEDWLISPALNMDLQGDEYLMFDYNDLYAGNELELYYSIDYNGGATPADVQAASWVNLPLDLVDIDATSCFSTLFQFHRAIDVSGISGANVYFAFKYTGLSSASKRYQIDNFNIEADYYGAVYTALSQGASCEPLMDEVHNQIKVMPQIPRYTSSLYDVWDAILVTDRRLNDAGNAEIVWDMFTDIPSGTGEFEFDHCGNRDNGSCPSGEGLCYNREHTLPRSWWGGGTAYPSDTMNFDMHHITPSDRQMNIYKLNYPPGNVVTPVSTGSNGFTVGYNPSYPNCSSQFFEPIDEFKGDYARMFFYMAARYKSKFPSWAGSNAIGDCAMDGTSYPVYEQWLLDVLLEWHANDAVSPKEIDRNNAVYAIQGNRNPFIDNPQWVGYIWGDHLGNNCATLSTACSPTTATDVVTACDSYTWIDGNTYFADNFTATDTLVNAGGCDSIVTLNLTIYNSESSTDIISSCGPYTWIDGITYTTSNNTATHTVTTVNGCDSVVTLNLTVNTPSSETVTATACDSYTWNGNTYTSSGIYSWTGTNIAGCDSVVTLDLTINSSNSELVTVTACDSYSWNGNTYTSSGMYTWTGTNVAGCDSVVTLDLTVNYSNSELVTATACDSYSWNGTTYTSSGTYTWTGTNAAGCDSIVTLDLTINNATSGTQNVSACGSYTWSANGNTYNSSGVFTATLTNAVGCDSTATLNLTISTFSSGVDVITACNTYTWIDGITYTTSNNTATHTISGGSVNGCDSVVTLDLTINYSNSELVAATACDSYSWNGNTYTSSGTYTWTGTNVAGCDSIVTLDLTINSSNSELVTATACDSYSWNGNTYTSSGMYTWTGTNVVGCDSVVTLDLTINSSNSELVTATACDSYSWNGNTYTSSGTYTWTGTNAAGCDSVVTLDLTINSSNLELVTAMACNSYSWNGNTYTSSGTYTWTGTNAAGCDSVVTLDLTINSSNSELVTATACDSYSWNGNTYTSSGTYTWTGTNVAGCDSVVTLDLTINSSNSELVTATACDSYSWNGNTYTSSGTYTWTGTNVAGCDSVVTLDLTVNSSTSDTISVTGLDSVNVNGSNYTSSGTYTQTLVNAEGCDSTLTVIVSLDFTGVESLENAVQIYPNPVDDVLTIKLTSGEVTQVNLYDVDGRKIRAVWRGEGQLDMTELAPGCYLIEVLTTQTKYSSTIIKQ